MGWREIDEEVVEGPNRSKGSAGMRRVWVAGWARFVVSQLWHDEAVRSRGKSYEARG